MASRTLLRNLLAACAIATPIATQALTVFTCEPEWAALVRELAPHAEVRSATHALQDPHHIEARPSLIAALRRADLAVCTGAGLEAGWLPLLQQRASNPRVQDGAPSMLYAADYVELIDPRPPGTPLEGDVHAAGNPHLHLDPRRLLRVAAVLSERLQELDPAQREQVRTRWTEFEASWSTRIEQWEQRAAPLRAMPIAAQHTTFAYLWRWLGIKQMADLEPLPGVAPSPGHLQQVLSLVRAEPPKAVVVSLYQDSRAAKWLSQQLDGQTVVLQLPSTVTDEPPASSLAGLFDYLLERLLEARR